MANEQNILPHRIDSTSKAREMGRKGGINSGKSKRKAKTMAQFASMIGKAPVTYEAAKEALRAAGVDDENMINAALVAYGVFKAAVMGDMKAVEKWQQLTEGTAPTPENTIKIVMTGPIQDLSE